MQESVTLDEPILFNMHDDSGHGWLEVPYRTLLFLRIHRLISKYSYLDGDTVYLEEDCDLPIFIQAWLRHFGKDSKDYQFFWSKCLTAWDGDHSPIRNLNHYYPR